MSYPSLSGWLPYALQKPLFGDRRRWGRIAQTSDPDWQRWSDAYMQFYADTQKGGIGKIANDAGYRILRNVDFEGADVFEFGPGSLPHRSFWRGKPAHYTVADIKQEFLDTSLSVLRESEVPATSILSAEATRSLGDASFDRVVSFYSLEHIADLDFIVRDLARVLKPGGLLVGGIPCEGGLAWGVGRYLTSRRYARRNFDYDPDKIICWEHPNFARDVLEALDREFVPVRRVFWPLVAPLIDVNLIASFIYAKR